MQEIVVPAAEQPTVATEQVASRLSRADLILWLAVCLLSSVAISAVRWPTFLGINALPWLHQGNDYPWRVWWRARTQYVNTSHHLTLYIVMGGALAIIFAGTAVICWLLLTHSSDDPSDPIES
jgi:hypothetical protein